MTQDIEDYGGRDMKTIDIDHDKYEKIHSFLKSQHKLDNWQNIQKYFLTHYHFVPKKKELRFVYEKEIHQDYPRDLVKKTMRSDHGVFVVSVVTSPYPEYTDKNGTRQKQAFSCHWKCSFCPAEPNQPKSYLKDEPGVLRANYVDFDTVKQVHVRLDSYVHLGTKPEDVTKLEIIVLGGTFSSYPKEYGDEMIRDVYYAANSWLNGRQERYSLEEEIHINDQEPVTKIIGITLETRPDCINLEEIQRYRRYNCTRVQIGVQHTDNTILKIIKRGHTIEHSMKALKLLYDNGYKVDIHIMPNLPGSNIEKDKRMIEEILNNPNLRSDQMKCYPMSIVPWSDLEMMYKQGKIKLYDDDQLMEILLYMKIRVPQWLRLNRVVRDIPNHYIMGGCSTTHMRQLLHNELKKRGQTCQCIRCRSVKNGKVSSNPQLKVQTYDNAYGVEHFISIVSEDDQILYGFVRLRIPDKNALIVLDEIKNCTLVRELHVYGTVNPIVNNSNGTQEYTQHRGFGKKLMAKAEEISIQNGYHKIAVIAGVGVRNYYRKLGYNLEKTFMIKQLFPSQKQNIFAKIIDFIIEYYE